MHHNAYKIYFFISKVIYFIGFLALICCTSMLSAQEDEVYEDDGEEYYEEPQGKLYMIEAMLDLGIPQAKFGDNLGGLKVGFGLNARFQLKRANPGFFGFDLYAYPVGSESDIIIDFVNGFDVQIRRQANLWITGGNLVYRYYPDLQFWVFEPYFEALIGMKWLFTTYNETDTDSDNNLLFEFAESSVSFSYGLSGGLQIPISDIMYFNIRTSYLLGNSVPYNVRDEQANGSNTDDPRDYFEIKNSATDLFKMQLGLSFIF